MIAAKHDSAPVYSDRDKRTIGKYLERYSEPESRWQASQFEKLPADGWDYVVTIPACGEDEYLPGALDSINKCQAARNNDKVLCIVMLNGNQAREEEFKSSNQRMRNWFNDNCMPVSVSLNPDDVCPQSLVRWRNIDILIIDRSQQPWLIPYDQGVGLVRKIAADLALFLISVGWVKSPWIHATDADARVPDDYFLRTNQQSGNSTELSSKACFIYPYQHIPDPDMEQQIDAQELADLRRNLEVRFQIDRKDPKKEEQDRRVAEHQGATHSEQGRIAPRAGDDLRPDAGRITRA